MPTQAWDMAPRAVRFLEWQGHRQMKDDMANSPRPSDDQPPMLEYRSKYLAKPTGYEGTPLWQVLRASFMFLFGIVLPLVFFWLSGILKPEWKGACRNGWLDCFIVGKVWLTPVVLFAVAAFFNAVVMANPNAHHSRWTVLGMLLGAIVSTVCLVIGLMPTPTPLAPATPLMLVPLYTAVWYSVVAVRLICRAEVKPTYYFGALLGSAPFWIASIIESERVFQSLPTKAPKGCFVVTAAARGHPRWVGPFYETMHHGGRQSANLQLIALWELERIWRQTSPTSHRLFRRYTISSAPASRREFDRSGPPI